MAGRVYVRDLQVLQDLDTELTQFNSGANTVLTDTAHDIQSCRQHLQARMGYWRAELRRRQDIYLASQRQNKSECRAEALAVQQAQEAIFKLQRFSSRLEQAIGEYQPQANRLQQLLGSKISKAKGDLRRSISRYQGYLGSQKPSVSSSTEKANDAQLQSTPLKSAYLNLYTQEDIGGHSEKHHGSQLTLEELKERVYGTHPTMRQSRAATKFINDKTHAESVNRAYNYYLSDIQKYFASGGENREWTFDCGKQVGIGFTNTGTRKNPTIKEISPTKVTICFKSHSTAPQGFYLNTAYPGERS